MKALMSPDFGDRKLGTWLAMAENGDIALPSFQRSYVWKSRESIEDYLLAVIQNRPTGVFLVLKTNGSPQFESRTLRGIDADVANASELLLDGQQRLTSLWHVLNGETGNVTYYAKVKDLKSLNVQVCDVVSKTDNSPEGKAVREPAAAYVRNLVPLEILQDKKDEQGIGQIWHWSKRERSPTRTTASTCWRRHCFRLARSSCAVASCTIASSKPKRTKALPLTSSSSQTSRPCA